MTKILGLDLGTNSIGIALRNTDNGNTLTEQLELFNSIIFKSGVGTGQTGEFSYAAERTKKRSARRLYQARKYRLWATLELLIKEGYCPLSLEDLDKWRRYDKEKGLKRQYPIHAIEFEQWVRLDFNGDGVADYSSPYQLRAELMQKQFDFTNQTDRYKLGRALYHIAQHRGFKSSKGETIKEQEDSAKETDIVELKKSEIKASGKLVEYMTKHNLPTVGCAFAKLEAEGERIKANEKKAVRSQYKDEVKAIFEFQNGLDISSDFYKRITSEKKGEGTIFYKRPLRSQKGNIGKCTLEPNKARCPISHPEFEEYRAWCLINNIKYRENTDSQWQTLSLELKQELFNDKFLRHKKSFQFQEIREWLEKKLSLEFVCKNESKTINYNDKTSVSACPISYRLKNILGNNYKEWSLQTKAERINKKTGETHYKNYDYLDLWHIGFSFDELDNILEFANNTLQFDNKQVNGLVKLSTEIQQGYANLSLKAIRNISRFLKQGFIYSNAVLLAKLPDIFKDKWETEKESIIAELSNVIEQNRIESDVKRITNNLISIYKSLDYEERFAEHDTTYTLQTQDYSDIEKAITKYYKENKIENKSAVEQEYIKSEVTKKYQEFFNNSKRDYYLIPKLSEDLAEYLQTKYTFLSPKDLKKIYHPSMIDIYPMAKMEEVEEGRYLKQLGSPVIPALKNPMAMRVLHTLRSQINDLIKEGKIDEHTRIVVETAREINDANMRWAIEKYQKKREELNKEIEKRLTDEGYDATDYNIRKAKIWCEQQDILDIESEEKTKKTKSQNKETDFTKIKYQLWNEQGFRCIYTGKPIKLSDLLNDDEIEIEHTIPRSISFDDSLSNQTVCYSDFNRNIKKNQYPTQLSNYEEILQRIKPWIEKVKHLEEMVKFWKNKAEATQDKEEKDFRIRQRHLWQMELDYWEKKVSYFTTKEVSQSYRNNQLNDTRIITKYAFHYLKTLFNRVDVQNGAATSALRKIIEGENTYQKKDRNKHSHHAIDATILTLIPSTDKRNALLELFYKKEEAEKIEKGSKFVQTLKLNTELEKEKAKLLPKGVAKVREFIEGNILVNHVSKNQALVPAKKRKRIRGKIVPLLDADGKVIFERDENGNIKTDKLGRPIPQAKQWITGDCIRGELHGGTFYGAITQNKTDKVIYVVRRELKHKANAQDSGFKDWNDLEKVIVDKDLFKIMKSQFPEGTDFKTAVAEGIYMLNNKGEKVNKIRHVRCIVPSVKNPLEIKKQTYKSKKEYKNKYYAAVGDLCAMSKYESEDKKKSKYIVWNLFGIITNRKTMNEDIPLIQNNLKLDHTLVKGDMLLVYDKNPQELYDMDKNQLQQRLYVISRFEGDGRIQLLKTINAEKEPKTESIKDFNKLPEKIRQSANGINYLIKGRDFDLVNGEIVFFNKNK
ncbi:MAG: HNH endonuclease domain-containing protein [Bacteroidales bacterium]|nr:HNH endonuclease domain-containing protein [Bacteroidales bacterium]